MQPSEIELRALGCLATASDIVIFRSLGLSKSSFVIYQEIYDFIINYYKQYKQVPSTNILTANFPMYSRNGIKSDEKEFYFKELRTLDIQRKATKILDKGASLLVEQPEEAVKYLTNSLNKLTQIKQQSQAITDKDALIRYNEYLLRVAQRKEGKTIGIKTGISFLDKENIGWLPGNTIGIYGRVGNGKTWLAVHFACAAYLDNKRVLFLSPELPLFEIQARIDTILGKRMGYEFNNESLQLGKPINAEQYKEFLTKIAARQDWKTLDSSNGEPFDVDNVRELILDFKPDFVAIDGFSLLNNSGGRNNSGWENVKAIAYGLKNIAMATRTVIAITHQANRKAVEAGEQARDKGEVGYTPEIHQIADGDDFSRACLLPDTLIRRASGQQGYMPICKFVVGDHVFTHLGRSRIINKLFKRFVDEEIVVLYLEKNRVVRVTKEHPIYTTVGWVTAGDITDKHILYKLSDLTGMGKNNLLPDVRGVFLRELKGKTFEEVYGVVKAAELRTNISINNTHLWKIIPNPATGKEPYNKGKSWEELFGVERAKELREQMSAIKFRTAKRGEEHYLWLGGIKEPYPSEFNKLLKQITIKQYGSLCQLCGITNEEHIDKYKRSLIIHHIDYNKKNLADTNLIPLCLACHSIVNFKRDEWFLYFSILGGFGGGIPLDNGTRVLKTTREHYSGFVHNLEVRQDKSYCGDGIIYHNCSVLLSIAQDPNEERIRYVRLPKLRNLKPFSRKIKVAWDVNIGEISFQQ